MLAVTIMDFWLECSNFGSVRLSKYCLFSIQQINMATDMKTQIDEHNTFIDAREGQANHNILTQFKKGLLVQINMQEPFSVADATMLIGAIKASRFPADIQKELETVVECKAAKIAVYASSAKGESGKRQELQQIRALKSGGLLTLNSPAPVVAQEPPKPRTLVLGTCPNSGKISIQPKAEINQEVEVDTAATTDSAVEADDKGDCVTIDSDSDALDAVSKAALKAMEKNLHAKRSKQLQKGLQKRLQSRKKNMRQQLQSKQGHHVQHQLLQLRSSR